ncbi:class I SAM-dependent methyltransferase [Petroclostridium sp. X23]|uniref:class I SAM-dependent methyltransferase n=1 Tax=Petroclostridium sp. X23 TaxID=3045146 RepID=UPI0024AC9134|nr:class I SAM-dependent methyltransferase [Petroclostridium sp. X23]WHH59983.1 methyltransferase domain-containing protein [Petroclostridium sp. X23]
MDVLTEKIQKRYDRVSGIYDFMEKLMDSAKMKLWREEIFEELSGKILEVGVGTGKNIEYYPDNANITAIDFSSKMLDKARQKADKLGKKIELMQMDAQSMDFEDNTFDTVFTTCVFCSVPDPIRGLREVRRVCKNNGKIIMLEHVRSEKEILGILMDIFNPLVVGTYGANINRRTVDNILKAGFSRIQVTDLMLDIVKKITIINTK